MNYENEELWQAMKKTKYLNTLREIKENVNVAEDIDGSLEFILRSFTKAVHAEAGTLWFYDKQDTGYIYPRAVFGGSAAKLAGIKLLPGTGIAGNVIKYNKSDIISDCVKDERWDSSVDEDTGFTTKSMICVPLAVEGYDFPFAAIQIINKVDGDLFDEKDLEFATELANEIVRLFTEKTDENLLQVMARRKINLRLDATINLLSEKAVKDRIKQTLDEEGYGRKESKEIIDCVMRIYKVVNK